MFEVKAKAFVDRFVSIYPTKYVTPYMHCTFMMHHISELMSLHGSILSFTQQGMEKYNDVTTIFVRLAIMVRSVFCNPRSQQARFDEELEPNGQSNRQ